MKNLYLSSLFLLMASPTVLAAEYQGFIGMNAVHLSLDVRDRSSAVYMYDKYNLPIYLTGKNDDSTATQLIFQEIAADSKPTANITLHILNDHSVAGEWRDLKTSKILPITLSLYDEAGGQLQSESLKHQFARINCADFNKEINLYNKKDGKLVHQISSGGECRSNDFSTGDYNFDGLEDFSVFRESFAGANTASNYYLFDPKKNTYLLSEQLGDTSLSFDSKSKIVTSTNQCCAGSQVIVESFKWQGSKLNSVKKECFKYSQRQDKLIKTRNNQGCD